MTAVMLGGKSKGGVYVGAGGVYIGVAWSRLLQRFNRVPPLKRAVERRIVESGEATFPGNAFPEGNASGKWIQLS